MPRLARADLARTRRRGIPVLALAVAAGLLAGCTSDPAPAPTASASGSAQEPAPAPTPTAPRLVPDGTAEDNLPLFTAVAQAVWASPQNAEGRAYIDALVAAGFDKTAMQVTDDATTIGNPAESMEFSVQWGQECLVGQVGPAVGTVITIATDALPNGGCLLGATRPIDW